MRLTQFFIIEITTVCNLGLEHKECPNMSPERWANVDTSRALTDDKICEMVHDAYTNLGFNGAVAWHYYNEPMCAQDRMLSLMERIKRETPQATFCLWTNGELIGVDCDYLKAFDMCWITDYRGGQNFKHVRRNIKNTRVMRWQLDKRIEPQGQHSLRPCGRAFSEFIVDHYGNVHLCCIDWQGNIDIGNVWDHALAHLVCKFNQIRDAAAIDMSIAPEFCQHCTGRHQHVSDLIPRISTLAKKFIREQRKGITNPPPPALPWLALAGVKGTGNSQEWREHHIGMSDMVEVFETFTEAAKWLQRCGAYFGAILTTGQRLSGPVQEALAIHPNENMLYVDCKTEDDVMLQPVVISRIRDVRTWAATNPQLRNRVKPIPIRLAELAVTSSDLPKKGRMAVTFVHYRIPESRLKEHFEWNDHLYRQHEAKVYVVTDRQYDVPDYAKCLVYPEPMPKFNLAKTSNYGIRYCIDSGYDLVMKTDADIAFPDDTFTGIATTQRGTAGLPMYRMASSYEGRATDYVEAPNATGTICMAADDWRKAHFHEECVGYGCDDGILRRELARQGIVEVRCNHVDHIAHIPGTPQQEFNSKTPRVDHWNRDEGFNPENFKGNRRLNGKVFASESWGLAGCDLMTVVITHYRMPRRRLDEFFAWNGDLFRKNRIRVIVVSDIQHDGLPDYARCAVYPGELPMFSLSKTSNYGIRLAGSGIICKADPDNAFSQEVINEMLKTTKTTGISPKFYMAASYEAREAAAMTWDASKGCLCLHWDHWQAIKGYDERCEGYGIEDGDCFHRAGQLEGHDVKRVRLPFWHIAHSNGKQGRGNMRPDCWGRKSGYNPRNHRDNCQAMRAGPWVNEAWGMPEK